MHKPARRGMIAEYAGLTVALIALIAVALARTVSGWIGRI